MALGIWNNEWLSENSQRRYPLSETATARDTTGFFTLPNDFIVDLIWSVHVTDSMNPGLFQLLSVTISATAVSLTLGYNGISAASVSISTASHTRNMTYYAQGVGSDFYDSVIAVTIGSLDNILAASVGTWVFDLNGGMLEPSVIRPDIRGVSGLILRTGTSAQDESDPIQGEVELAAGTNIRLTVSEAPSGRTRIRIDAIDGEGLNESCVCGGAAIGPPIRRINGIPPDADGNFTLEHDDCLSFEQMTNGIKLVEECASPCCGCDELNVLREALNTLTSRIASIDLLANNLAQTIAQTQSAILASKFGSQGTCPS